MKFAALALLLPFLSSTSANDEPMFMREDFCSMFALVGTVSFEWSDPTFPDSYTEAQKEAALEKVNISPDYVITWGDCIGRDCGVDAPPSGLVMDQQPEPLFLPQGQEERIGTLTHNNNPIGQTDAIAMAKLKVTLNTLEFGVFEFNYGITVDETPNTGDIDKCPHETLPFDEDTGIGGPCADLITFVGDGKSEIIEIDDGQGNKKQLRLSLTGFRKEGVPGEATFFISQEGGDSSADLYAELTVVECEEGGSFMDPHFETWSGQWYDFQGACDLHLLTAPHFAPNLPMTIDIRTKTRDWYSYIESAAIQIGDEILEVASFGLHLLNGVGGFETDTFAGFKVTYENPDDHTHVVEIHLDEAKGEKIMIRTFKDFVSVKVHEADESRMVGASGMMGDPTTGLVHTRDGKIVLSNEDPDAIAREWQVRGDEPMLFQSKPAIQYPQQCKMPKFQQKPRLGKTIAVETAQKACAHWTKATMKNCVSDVLKTGDLEFAKVAAM